MAQNADGSGPMLASDRADEVETLLRSALQHHQSGQWPQAEALYRRILTIKPQHLAGLNFLGLLSHQTGDHEQAIDLIGRAIALNDRVSDFHNNIAEAYRSLGRLDDAVSHLGRALDLEPAFKEAHNNLGNVLRQRGQVDEALACYRRALELDAGYADARFNLAVALRGQGRLDEAVAQYRALLALDPNHAKAINNLGNALRDQARHDESVEQFQRLLAIHPHDSEAPNNLGVSLAAQGKLLAAVVQYERAIELAPDSATAHSNLANTLKELGRLDEAATKCRRAIELRPDFPEAWHNLASALLAQEQPAAALDAVRRALALRETTDSKELFVTCVRSAQPLPDDPEMRRLLLRALSEPWGRPNEFATACASLIKLDTSDPAGSANDPLLCALLEAAPVCGIAIERALTEIRKRLLAAADDSTPVDDTLLAIYCALARQCFINEYVFACGDDERDAARRLSEKLVAALRSGATIPVLWPVAVAAYLPLHSIAGVEALPARPCPTAVAAVLDQQIREPQEERQYAAAMPRLTGIEDEVSRSVRRQYEENPYPRWVKTAAAGEQQTVVGYLRREFPLALIREGEHRDTTDILIAGCGTGRQAIEAAQRFPRARVLAVDLSLASLGYARRKAAAAGLTNIEYGQADILALTSLGRKFDAIETSGVLHHLAEPMRGWQTLLSLLRPGGFMRLGLYSKLARADIVAARAFIAKNGYRDTPEGIRRCRADLVSSGDAALRNLATSPDFFSTSACRDLLFHVQEQHLTLPEIKTFLAANKLTFLGFSIDPQTTAHYRTRFPHDATATNLDLWHVFESENPSVFAAMYQFWVQLRP